MPTEKNQEETPFLEKVALKLPFVKQYRQYDLTTWSKRKILTRLFFEAYSHTLWYLRHYFTIRKHGLHKVKQYGRLNLSKLSSRELISLAKHEGHRIEKAFYAGYMKTSKYSRYHNARENIAKALAILENRGELDDRPDLVWLGMIHDSFHEFDNLIKNKKKPAPSFNPAKLDEYMGIARERRSTRTWAEPNIADQDLPKIAKQLIECAKWSPCSGNRQPWYFRILIKEEDKNLLKGIKEEHCIKAPLLIFVGINRSSYGAIGNREQGIHVDGGAIAMQMVMAAHQAGLGSCWNHFCKDFIYSRPKNLSVFRNFYRKMNIPKEIEPIALIAFGIPSFISPPPERPPFESLCPDSSASR